MNGRDKLSVITFSFFWFLGLYVIMKFFLILFWTMSFSSPFVLELTPFFVFKLGPLQLLVLSAIIVGLNAYLHFNDRGWNIAYSFVPTSMMIAGVGLALYTEHWNDPFYYIFFIALLGIAIVDHRYLLRINGYGPLEEEEEESGIEDESDMDELIFDIDELYGKDEYEPDEEKIAWPEVSEEEYPYEPSETDDVLEDLERIEVVPEIIKETDRTAYKNGRNEAIKELEELQDFMDIFDQNGEENGSLEPESDEEKFDEEMESIESYIELLLDEEIAPTRKECPACGFMNDSDSTRCSVCGSELEEGEK